jgi:transposase
MQGSYLKTRERKILQQHLDTELRSEWRRRIEIMLLADIGKTQSQICDAVGCSQKTAGYWMLMLQIGQAHRWNDNPVGRPKVVSDEYVDRLKVLVYQSPRDYGYSTGRWTAEWLRTQLANEFDIQVSNYHITRLLKSMGIPMRQLSKVALNH